MKLIDRKKIKIILQARTQSYRLLGKSLLPVGGLPLAVLCAKRLSNRGHEVIAVIPKGESDDALNSKLIENKIKVFRGSHENVLKRYFDATKKMNSDTIVVRATADNPFPDGSFIEEMVRYFIKLKKNYINTHDKHFNFPYGMAVQIFKLKFFRILAKRKLTRRDKEHVVSIFSRDAEKTFYFGNYPKHKKLKSKKKFSIDNLKDYIFIEKIFRSNKDPERIKWSKILKKWL